MRSMLVIGLGHFGTHLALKLSELGNEVMVVDRDEEAVNKIAPQVTTALVGDCMSPEILKSLGVGNFDICFVCISDNFQSSMEITSLLKEQGAKFVVAKADREIHARLLSKIGADHVVSPERDMAQRTAARFSAHGAFDYIELSPEYAIMEIVPPTEWVGRNIRDLKVRTEHRINVIGIRVDNKHIQPMTSAEHVFTAHEHIIVAGENKDILRVINKNGH